jgi:hypothetical protein
VKNNREDRCQKQLANPKLHELLEKHDLEMLEQARQAGCPPCQRQGQDQGKLHRADYPRKPRGGPARWDKRHSLCCADCRRRVTPASVRFFGRRFFVAPFFVLICALNYGLTAARVRRVSEIFGVDRRTLARWRQWWLEQVVRSAFWKEARVHLMPPPDATHLPGSLLQSFGRRRDRLLKTLQFLAPLTVPSTAVSRVR